MSESLIHATLVRLVTAVERQRAAACARHGMTPAELLALAHLQRSGPTSPAELARVLLLSSGGTTAVIDRLARAGLVERTRATARGSRTAVSLTREGQARMDALSAPLEAAIAAELGGAESFELPVLERLLVRLADAAERDAEHQAAEVATAATAAASVPGPIRWG